MLKNLPIRLKLSIIYVLMTIFTIAIYVVSILWFSPIVASNSAMGKETIPAATAVGDASAALWQRGSAIQQAAANPENTSVKEAALTQAGSAAKTVESALSQMEPLLTTVPGLEQAKKDIVAASAALQVAENSLKPADISSALAAVTTANTSLSQVSTQLQTSSLVKAEQYNGTVGNIIIFYIIYTVFYAGIVWIAGRILAKAIAFPLQDLEAVAHAISLGDVEVKLDYSSKDEIGRLAVRFQEMLEGIKEQAHILAVISEGDFTADIKPRSEKDIVNTAIAKMIANNNILMSEIRTASTEVSAGAHQIANGSQGLASGATQQASSVDEFNSTLHNVKQQTIESADTAKKALELIQQSGDKMEKGIQSMELLQQAMASIDESSQNITKMNKVIDDIAFQTNILALNAAVEAARAGQHGKGFAVVADEVRNLAAKSAAAAKETALLVEGSSQRVQEGHTIVRQTSDDINAVGQLSRQNLTLIQEISGKAELQAHAIAELAIGLDQISMVVQSNSATAEESAAAAEEMSAQANMLNDIVGRFAIKGQPAAIKAAPSMQIRSAIPTSSYTPAPQKLSAPAPTATSYTMAEEDTAQHQQYSNSSEELPEAWPCIIKFAIS